MASVNLIQAVQQFGFVLTVDMTAHSTKRYRIVQGGEVIQYLSSQTAVQGWVEQKQAEAAATAIEKASSKGKKSLKSVADYRQIFQQCSDAITQCGSLKLASANLGRSTTMVTRLARMHEILAQSIKLSEAFESGSLNYSRLYEMAQSKKTSIEALEATI